MNILNAVNDGWLMIAPSITNFLSVLFFLLLGYLIARCVAWLSTAIFKLIQLDSGAQKIGFSSLLEKADIKRTPAELIGDLFYWIILFSIVIGTAKLYSLPIEPAMDKVFSFLGLVILASIILGTGLFFAAFISTIVRLIASNFGIDGAKTLSRLIYYIVVVFAFLAALSQLGIGTEVFIPQLGVIIGAFGLAAAIAFGLGCKDMAADFLYNLFRGK
jgi:hypothetical protein